MKPKDAVALYTRYVGDWGTTSTVYKFEAVRDGKVVKTVIKEPMQQAHLEVKVSAHNLTEGRTYDMAAVRIRALDENGNVLGFFNEPVQFEVKGVLELIGPKTICLQGGMGGTYVKTTGQAGEGILTIEKRRRGKSVNIFRWHGKSKGEIQRNYQQKKNGIRLGADRKRYGIYAFGELYSVLLPGCSRSKCDGNGNYSHGSAGV